MAGKPFLSRLKKRKKSYDETHTDGNSLSATNSVMAGRYRSSSGSTSAGGDAPPPKKRKTEEETVEEEEWDDFDVTQADLEDLEIQASQAYAGVPASQQPTRQQHSEPQPSTSRTFDRATTDTSGRFVKPTLSRHSTSSSSSGQSHGRLSNQSLPPSQNGRGSRQLAVNSSSSMSSSSTNPKSLTSSEGSRTSLSIHSGSSEEIHLAQERGSLSRGMSSESSYSIDVTGILGRDHADMSHGADASRQETAGFQKQIDDMKSELYAKEGEIKILRDKLSGQESELHKMKSEKIGQIAQQNKQQKEKEKGLQDEVSRLKDRYDFSEHEKRVLESRCRDLEGQIKLLQTGPTASQALPPTQTSPTPRRVPVERKTSPKISSSFPSKSSFHANEASPRKQIKGDSPRKLTKGEDPVRTSSAMVQTVEAAQERQSRRRNLLNVATSCKSSGSQLVARLLYITPSNIESPSNRGIAGLLHTPAASTTVESVSFDRDKDTSLLSPCRKRISDVQALLEAQEKPETSSIVSQDHFYIAIHGLTQLLQSDNSGALVSENGAPVSEETANANQCVDNEFDSAVLVLPLLKDYLSHYLRMLETSTDSFEASPSISSSSSGSFESSVESSLGLFLKDSTAYANNLESLALASLRTLHILTMCRSVRNVLLGPHSMEEISDSSGGNSSGSSKSVKPSTSVEKIERRTRLPKEYLQNLNMLRLLVKLADPGSKGHLFNAEIVETSLSTLTLLANHATEQQIPSLLPLISDEVLHNCLECESEPTVICRCLQLLRSLVRSNAIVSGLCANASECVLLCLYHVSTCKKFNLFSCDTQLQISEQVINLLSDIASLHKGGLTILLESDCICSVEVVQTIVTLLYNVLKLHEKENSSPSTQQKGAKSPSKKDADIKSFSILQKGTLLLHQMYQHEIDFVRRHSSVQHQYVLLIQQLSRIFRDAGIDQFEDEISAVQDLWDFSPDEEDYESSHDTSQEELNMDTS